nr:putative phage abortive infection protein [Halobacillus litoralis]
MFNKIQKEEDQLYYYFRNLYQVFKCIHKQRSSNVITEDEQNEYIEYIDAQLSKRERHLLYFNVHFFNEHNKQKENTFKEILSDFNFFEKHNFSGEKIEQEFIEETKKKTRNM